MLNIDDDTITGIFALVSAVLHIGNFEFQPSADGESTGLTSTDKKTTEKVAKLLGVCNSHIYGCCTCSWHVSIA